MEETAFLFPMQRRIGGIKVQNQPPRGPRVGLDQLIQQNLVKGHRRPPVEALLETAQGGGTGQGFHPRGCRLQGQIVAPFLVVIEVFIPQGKGVDALP